MSSGELSQSRRFEAVNEILKKHEFKSRKLIAVLQEVQEIYRYLPEEVLMYVATGMGLTPSQVFGVVTFYENFSLEPKGKYVIRVCDGTACHVRHSEPILSAIRKRLQLEEDQTTTPDLLFSVETVACLGACVVAPVVSINGEIYGQMTPDNVVSIINELIRREEYVLN